MRIKTKFKPDDDVYFICLSRDDKWVVFNEQKQVKSFFIFSERYEPGYSVFYDLYEYPFSVSENNIFKTKDEAKRECEKRNR